MYVFEGTATEARFETVGTQQHRDSDGCRRILRLEVPGRKHGGRAWSGFVHVVGHYMELVGWLRDDYIDESRLNGGMSLAVKTLEGTSQEEKQSVKFSI